MAKKWFVRMPQQDKSVLRPFLGNFYWAESLSDEEARNNLERSVVEVTTPDGQHISNGLLISRHGYFITNFHCVKTWVKTGLDTPFLRLGSGKSFPISHVVGHRMEDDIAIVKASIPGKHEHLTYKFYKDSRVIQGAPLVLLGQESSELKPKSGFCMSRNFKRVMVQDHSYALENQVEMDIEAIPGDSGGPIVTVDKRVFGIITVGTSDGQFYSSCTFWFRVLNLITEITN